MVSNRPLLDIYERAGFVLATRFLRLSGIEFTPPEGQPAIPTRRLAAGEIDEHGCGRWLRVAHGQGGKGRK